MQNLPKWKTFLSIICTIFAVICALPNFTRIESKYLPHDSVNLGLDLRGGAHLLLDVDFNSYLNDTMENLADSLRRSFREDKIGYKNLLVKQNNIQLELRSQDALKPLKRIISKIDPEINVEASDNRIKLSYSESRLSALLNKVVDQSIEIVRMRVDSTGTKDPILQKQGDRHILLQVPGEEDPTYLKNILGKTAKLTFHLVDENANVEEAIKGHVPMGSMLVQGDRIGYLVVQKKPILGGDSLTTSAASFDQNSQAVVSFAFNSLGSKLFGEITKNNVGKHLAIVLDHKLLSAPTINQPIMGGSGIISGDFTVE